MKKGLTEIICVIDKSGSMHGLASDVIGGFNKFLSDQKKLPGDAKLTLVLFDTTYTIVHNGVQISDVPDLTDKSYIPGGCTALLDATGRTIDEVGARLYNTSEKSRPEKVVFCIMTDGYENSSREYSKKQVADKIKLQTEDYKWDFIYLGANVDVFAEAGGIGIRPMGTQSFAATGQGISSAYFRMSNYVSSTRTTGKGSFGEDRD